MRYRKNIECLTTDELHDLREALAAMYALPSSDAHSFASIGSFHGGPPTAYCRHGAPGFLTWHRAYLMAFEEALRRFNCDITLPYWDWSSGPTTGVPEACRFPTYVNRSSVTVANPLYSGPRPGGGQTARGASIDTTSFADLATSAQAALSAATLATFQSQLNGVHGSVHVRVGGDMGSVPSAGYDPIFYLHHANIDRLWASWQASHTTALPASESSFELQPFNRPYSTQWQTGADVRTTSGMGYQYLRFCLVLPPIRIWEVLQIDWPIPVRARFDSARLVIKSAAMQAQPVEIRAFVNDPNASAATKTAGNPAFAGAAGFMGHAAVGVSRSASERIRAELMELAVPAATARAARPAGVAGVAIGVGVLAGDAEAEARSCPACIAAGHTHDHAHHHEFHSHGQPQPAPAPRPAPEPRGSVAERFDVEVDLTAAVRAVPRDSKQVALKLVAVGPDGRELPADAVRVDGIELMVE